MYIYIDVFIYTYTHIYIYIYISIFIYIYIYIYKACNICGVHAASESEGARFGNQPGRTLHLGPRMST